MSESLSVLEQQVQYLSNALKTLETSAYLGPENQPKYVPPHLRPGATERPANQHRVHKHKTYSDQQVLAFNDGFNAFWEAITGKHIDFEFNAQEQPYITPSYHFLRLNEVMYELLKSHCNSQPWIADLCGGSGSDLICMLMGLGAARIDYVESSTWEGANAFENGMRNVHNFIRQFDEFDAVVDFNDQYAMRQYLPGGHTTIIGETTPGRTMIVPCNMEIQEYFRRLPENSHINMCYIDPPFSLAGDFEATDKEMVDWFVQNVIQPMKFRNVTTDYFCIKSRVPPKKFKDLLSETQSNITFVAVEACVPFRESIDERRVERGEQTKGVFYWIFFANDIMRAGVYTNSHLWNSLVNKDRDVVVDRRKYLRPVFPKYAQNTIPDEVVGPVEGGDLVLVKRRVKSARYGPYHNNHRPSVNPAIFTHPLRNGQKTQT